MLFLKFLYINLPLYGESMTHAHGRSTICRNYWCWPRWSCLGPFLPNPALIVTVFERSSAVGGRNKVLAICSQVDLGPTFFHYPEVIEDIFKAIGMDAHEELNLHRPREELPLDFRPGGQLDCTSNLDEMTERIQLSGDSNPMPSVATSQTTESNLRNQKPVCKNPGYGLTDLLSAAMRVATVATTALGGRRPDELR